MRKKLLHSALLVLGFTPSLFGQFGKGGTIVSLSGTLGYETQDQEGAAEAIYEGWDFVLIPRTLYFASDHWALGGSIGAVFASGSDAGLFGPEVRYYFNPRSESANWYAHTRAIMSYQSEFFFDAWGLGMGLNLFLSPNLAFEAQVGIDFFDDGVEDFFSEPTYGLNTGLLIYLSREDWKQWKPVEPVLGKGAWMVGAAASDFSFRFSENRNTSGIGIAPRAGYFFTNGLVAGLGLEFSYRSVLFNKQLPEFEIKTEAFSVGAHVFSRYYFGPDERRLRPFLHGEIGVARSEIKTEGELALGANRTDSWLSTKAGVGANLFIAPGVALEGLLNYASSENPSFTTSPPTSYYRFGFDLGLQVFLAKKGDQD